jgi:hypothetical protein
MRLNRYKSMPSQRILAELTHSGALAHKLDLLVEGKQAHVKGDSQLLLLGYWHLLATLHTGTLVLIDKDLEASAFALVRPIVETTIRAHLSVIGDPDDLRRLCDDTYRTNFSTVGKKIDLAFQLNGTFETFLRESRNALHSFTHSGLQQFMRQYRGTELCPDYPDDEVSEIINVATSSKFLLANAVTKFFGWDDLWLAANNHYREWGARNR